MDILEPISEKIKNATSVGDGTEDYLCRGTPAFKRAYLGIFLAGLITFAVLYDIQPLMPALAEEFHLTPASASLSLSVATAAISAALVLVGSLSEALGRKKIMAGSIMLSSTLAVAVAFSPNYHTLLVLRAIQGVVLAGLPVAAMAYLSEEVHASSLGYAMGLYISGNSIGGIAGRVVAGTVADAFSWRAGLGAIGLFGIVISVIFYWILPESKHFSPRAFNARSLMEPLIHHLKDQGLLLLYATGALLMGSFVTLFNFISFRLLAAPYHLSQTLVGWIFIVYLAGTFSSTWMGQLADRIGRRIVLAISVALMLVGIGLTAFSNLPIVIAGMIIFTFGFFGGHSIASSWVGRRALMAKAQASSLYLFFYYMGSSIFGYSGGVVWARFHWQGLVLMIGALLLMALVIAMTLYTVAPTNANAQKRSM